MHDGFSKLLIDKLSHNKSKKLKLIRNNENVATLNEILKNTSSMEGEGF